MGYNTDFYGSLTFNKKVDTDTIKLVNGIGSTRRMNRDMSKLFPDMSITEIVEKFGYNGEFYIDGEGFKGQDEDASILDYNCPPPSQPGLWCDWVIDNDGKTISWNGNEKSYDMKEWIEYLINRIFAPRGYILNGEVEAQGEEMDDRWKIIIKNNKVKTSTGHFVYD